MATRVGTLPDLVEEGRTGLLVPIGDPDALADAIANLAETPENAETMGLAARKRVEERFTLDGVADAFEGLLTNLPRR